MTAGAKVELKQAQQKMMINTPLSPTSSRKDVSSKAKEEMPQTYSHLSGRTIASDKSGSKGADPSLKSDIANMDTQHSEKMKEIQTRHEEREKKQQLISPMSLTSSSVSTSSSAVPSSTFVKSETTKVQAAAQGKNGGGQTRSDQDKTQSPVEGTRAGKPAVVASILNDVTSDLKKLDNGHSAQMKQIEEKFKEQDLKTRQPPSTDHHSARPANLGRSRFETGSAGPSSSSRVVDAKVAADSLRTQFELDRHVPRRNETVHDMSSSIAKEPSVVRSATTILDVRQKSPEPARKFDNAKASPDAGLSTPTLRKRFDRNFNASPEPFPSAKITGNSRFSESSTSYIKSTGTSTSYTSSLSTAQSTSKPYSSTSYSPPSSYSSNSYNSTSFPSPADSFTSSMTSTSSYFTSTPSASSYTPSYSTLDRSRSEATIANSKSSAGLSARIQATKDQHKLDIKKAMDFDRTTLKPPIITQKLPRPEPGKYSNLSSSMSSTIERSEREGRRMERERAVLERVLGDRTSRGKSDDLLAKTPSYRL